MKTCTKCHETKPLDRFHLKRKGGEVIGYRNPCKDCTAARQRSPHIREYKRQYRMEWRHAQPERAWAAYLHFTHDMTPEQYTELLTHQGGVCAICGSPPQERRLTVDHDHITGAIRGLLCHPCNVVLGMSSDSPLTLRAAALYLERTWVKIECPSCGYVARTTRKWIDDVGLPTCACGTDMEVAS